MSDVERQEEHFLATSDAKARHDVEEAPAVEAGPADIGEIAADMTKASEGRWGSGEVQITDVTFTNSAGETTQIFHSGEPVTVTMTVRARHAIDDFVFGIGIFNAEGVCVYGTNTDIEEFQAESLSGEAVIGFEMPSVDLVEGTYKLDVAVHKLDGAPYDYHRLLYTFRIKSRLKDVGVYRPNHRWQFSPNARLRLKV